MKRVMVLTAAGVAALWITASAARVDDAPLDAAALAWERGDYVAALTTYLQVLDSQNGDEAFEAIALQTGELFQTTEITADGNAPAFSADGKYLTYEVGTALARRTRLVSSATPATVLAEMKGSGAVFSPDGSKLAYLALDPSDELEQLQAGLDRAEQAERAQRQAAVNQRIAQEGRIVVRDIGSGAETPLDTGALRKASLAVAANGSVYFAGTAPDGATQVYVVSAGQAPSLLTSGPGDKSPTAMSSTGAALLYTVRAGGGGRGAAGRGGATPAAPAPPAMPARFGVINIASGAALEVAGTAPSLSADGASLTYVGREGNDNAIMVASVSDPVRGTAVRRGPERVDAPALSADGSRVVFQMMPREDWELFAVTRDGNGRDTPHARDPARSPPPFPRATTVSLRRWAKRATGARTSTTSSTGRRTRLFHNNTVRTIAPEYAWVPSADGTKLLIGAERDGDTVSPERGVYLMDLTRKVTRDELRARVEGQSRRRTGAARQGAADRTRQSPQPSGTSSATRRWRGSSAYEKALFDFDSKHITRPGNKLASAYLFDNYKSFGYAPEYQWFARTRRARRPDRQRHRHARRARSTRSWSTSSAATTTRWRSGPGADDDSSGTAALLEAARILARHPQPATIVFASFTGEEAGLLGSREFVRRAVADKVQIVGALNNDMVGWANDHRLDNTIRYSNPGIRDVQHAAAMQFSEPDHLRRALLQEHRRRRLLRSLRRHRRRHRLVSRCSATRTTTSRTICSTRSTTSSSPRSPRPRRRR